MINCRRVCRGPTVRGLLKHLSSKHCVMDLGLMYNSLELALLSMCLATETHHLNCVCRQTHPLHEPYHSMSALMFIKLHRPPPAQWNPERPLGYGAVLSAP